MFKAIMKKIRAGRLMPFAIVVCLVLAIGAAAYATDDTISSPEEAEKAARQEIEVWKEMGLLMGEVDPGDENADVFEFPEEVGDDYWFGRIFKHRYDVRIASEKYSLNITLDAETGKIVMLSVQAAADEEDVPVRSLEIEVPYGPDPEQTKTETWYFYNNFEDIFPPERTLDEFCTLLAEYWGFSGYTLSDTEDEMYHETWEAVSGDSLLKDLYSTERANYYLTVFFEGDQQGAPMYVQLNEFPECVNLLIGTNHAVG